VNAIGGGSTSPVWTQIISDVTGLDLQVVEHPLEAGAIGAALTVAVGMGIYPNMEAIDELIQIKQVVTPIDDPRQKRYEGLYHEYRELYAALVPIYRRLYGIP
jgi:sugar (pentulose or hexulose) kinase